MTKIFKEFTGNGYTGETFATADHKEYRFIADLVADTDPDLSWLGKFSNTQAKRFSIPHKGGARSYKYFNAENVSNMQEAQQNYKRAKTFGESWDMVGVTVRVIRAGVKLGECSLWGIESDSGHEYFMQVANENAAEALAEAQKKLKELCGKGE